ncbi:MAG: aldo/keto reductase [Solobacterium sp.]|nr:aldo/keto reductase [Solobacterium sp.]MDD6956622.1 aldo/keto reductase [Solobacterium sp.]MDY4642292.1 aldo/keto reductase [Erysipelotrichaceae bacterium]
MQYTKLLNNIEIPMLGYGTYKTAADEEGLQMIKDAIKAGYRHIDTAQGYKNEHLVGQAIRESGIPRNQFFVTTKVWNDNQGYDKTKESIEESLNKLNIDYIDLLLIHWPIPQGKNDEWKKLNQETWKAMEEYYDAGLIKAIGVSNFLEHHLNNLLESARIMPMVNQLEIHPYYQQQSTVKFCQDKGIIVESWGPLMRGKAFKDPKLIELAQRNNISVAQLCIRYCLDRNIVTLQKSSKFERMIDNARVFGYHLDEYTMNEIAKLDTDWCYTFHPDRNEEWFKK